MTTMLTPPPLAAVSPGLAAVITRLADYKVAAEYGRGCAHEVEFEALQIGELVASAELAHLSGNGGLPEPVRRSAGRRWLDDLVAESLATRLCQCAEEHLGHEAGTQCDGHFDVDAEVTAEKRCGFCVAARGAAV